jgi:glutamine amidotransferase
MKIGIIDYGMGNIFSVNNIFKKIDSKTKIIKNPEFIKSLDIIVLPGVGAFPKAIENLKSKKFYDEIKKNILIKKKPIIGICLGMQLFFNKSFEIEETNGFSFIDGEVKYIFPKSKYINPNVGWNKLSVVKNKNIFKNLKNKYFYFDHSYECIVKNKNYITSNIHYGNLICSSVRKENIFGFQFHPEKSQYNGVLLLSNVINLLKKII